MCVYDQDYSMIYMLNVFLPFYSDCSICDGPKCILLILDVHYVIFKSNFDFQARFRNIKEYIIDTNSNMIN